MRKFLIRRGKPPLPRTKSVEDFNPLLAKERKWDGNKLKSFPLLIENIRNTSHYYTHIREIFPITVLKLFVTL
jgi:hypothetical protein